MALLLDVIMQFLLLREYHGNKITLRKKTEKITDDIILELRIWMKSELSQ